MKRVLCFTTILFALVFSGCKPESVGYISVDQNELTFRDYKPEEQIIIVKADTEWRASIVGHGVSEWLRIEKVDESTLKLSAVNNITDKIRKGKVVLRSVNASNIIEEIFITQDSHRDYRVTVNSETLSFEAKNAPMQELSIITDLEDLTWSIDAEESVLKWVNCVVKGSKIEVTVTDNVLSAERIGLLKIVADKTYINPIIVTIKQDPPVSMKVILPNIIVNNVLTVEGGVKLNAMIEVKAGGTDVDIRAVDTGGQSTLYSSQRWLMAFWMPGYYSIQALPYEEDVDRECTVTIVCLKDESQNVSFKVIQKALIK